MDKIALSNTEEISLTKNNKPDGGTHAVVIGSGLAGLSAARVLAGHFDRVTLVDRDRLDAGVEFRPGAPQARHAHSLLPQGQAILEQQFPGLVHELLANGAVAIDQGREAVFFDHGTWRTLRDQSGGLITSSSRALLENTLYRRLCSDPRIRIWQGLEATGLGVDAAGQRVTGVWIRERSKTGAAGVYLAAGLVVDASGRGSRAAHWLGSLGYPTPRESVVDAHTGYASRLYQVPDGFSDGWKKLYISPEPPDSTRGGIILPLEGGRWHVTLVGMAGDFPPTGEAGFLAFAHSLPSGRLYDAIREATPLTRPFGYRSTENRQRNYDRLPQYLEGFLVLGDAVATLNPVYMLGMTAAALGTQALDEILREQFQTAPAGESSGLAGAFQKRLSQATARLWRLAIAADLRWPETTATQVNSPAAQPILAPAIFMRQLPEPSILSEAVS